MITREGRTITLSYCIGWDYVHFHMDDLMTEHANSDERHVFSEEEIDDVMDAIETALSDADGDDIVVDVQIVVRKTCAEWLVEKLGMDESLFDWI